MPTTTRLEETNRPALRAHLLSLGSEDRHLRFGFAARDATIERYVADIDFKRDAVFGVRGVPGKGKTFDGIIHLALENNHAEIGLSVLKPSRGCGIGKALVARAATYARNHGIKVLFMQCLTANRAIMHIAHALGMKVVVDGTQSEANLVLPAGDAMSVLRELEEDQIALCDAVLGDSMLSRETQMAASARGYITKYQLNPAICGAIAVQTAQ